MSQLKLPKASYMLEASKTAAWESLVYQLQKQADIGYTCAFVNISSRWEMLFIDVLRRDGYTVTPTPARPGGYQICWGTAEKELE